MIIKMKIKKKMNNLPRIYNCLMNLDKLFNLSKLKLIKFIKRFHKSL